MSCKKKFNKVCNHADYVVSRKNNKITPKNSRTVKKLVKKFWNFRENWITQEKW